MRLFLAGLLFAAVCCPLFAQGTPDERYLNAYELIQEADRLQGSGQSDLARTRLEEAQAELKKLKSIYPNWNSKVVQFRLSYVEEKLGLETTKPAAQPSTTPAPPVQPPEKPTAPVTPAEPAPVVPNPESPEMLKGVIARLQQENAVLQAKLQEALSPQPATLDPAQLAQAEERIKALEKDRELLKVALEKEQAATTRASQAEALQNLQKELAAKEATINALRREAELIEKIRTENTQLKEKLAQTKDSAALERELAAAREGARTNALAVEALQASLRQLNAQRPPPPPTTVPDNADSQTKQLQKERDDLLLQLAEARDELYQVRQKSGNTQATRTANQIAVLRARLEALEARKSPYTSEELALMKAPQAEVAATPPANTTAKKGTRELPPGAGLILAEAQRAFSNKRFDVAAEKYGQVLRMDENNVFALGNLAVVQLEQEKLSEAEATLSKALAADPEDAKILSLMGILRFRQEKYDDALDALSRSVQLNAKNPEAQNYLGITLSQKGQRSAAEAALRKALEIAPGYPSAHHNLAVIYATQKPPYLELARFHYEKALAGGHAPNAELENTLKK
ncbi:MAG: tetratricopeptide repeat protein [Verrucomicrobiota bacterium]|nr:tetratricopeptide repeat protein [Verrucomicrobiota bacterium]